MRFAETPEVVLCVAPHPDDETLGCGGTLLRHIASGDPVHWLVVTAMTASQGYTTERIASRQREIEAVAEAYGFASVDRAGLPTTRLDTVPKGELIAVIADVIRRVAPTTVYVPYRNDAHSDHTAVFDATVACCKRFRHPSVARVRAYETLSETEFGMRPEYPGFRPNLFVDITTSIARKIEIMSLFAGEMGEPPFPRSAEAIRALASYRGVVAGARAAEAFMVLRDVL